MISRRSLLTVAGLGTGALLLPTAPAARAAPTDVEKAPTGPVIELPAPTTRRPIGTIALHLVDHDRQDPFAPTPQPRELMVQLWYPALTTAGRPRAPYISPLVAATVEAGLPLTPGTLAAVRPHARVGAPAVPGRLPLLLLGHGRQGHRSNCTALAEELAAHGYLVAAVDHTYDAGAVEFPDGRLVRSVLPDTSDDWDTQDRKEIAARVGDLRFVATELTSSRFDRRPGVPRPAPERIAVFGHSMGGAASAVAMLEDDRFTAGADLDGAFFGSPVAQRGLDRPFLLLTALADHPTWQQWRDHQRGWGRQLRITGTGHLTFTDLPHFAGPGGVAQSWPPDLYAELLGSLGAGRSTELIRTYTRSFFDQFLKHRHSPLLEGPSQRYPEIQFRWSRG